MRLQGFTKDLTSAESNSILLLLLKSSSSFCLPNELHIERQARDTLATILRGLRVSITPLDTNRTERTLEVSEYERKQRRSVDISISQLHKSVEMLECLRGCVGSTLQSSNGSTENKVPVLAFFLINMFGRRGDAFSTDSMTPVADECIPVEEFD